MKHVVSFVHGYTDDSHVNQSLKPGLVVIDEYNKIKTKDFYFPRNVAEYESMPYNIRGETPLASAQDFKSLPRFGLTGLSQNSAHIFAGSWNGVYALDKKTLSVEHFISHRLMNDLHGICANENTLLTVLTGKDTVVVTDLNGNIRSTYTIQNDLKIVTDDPKLLDHDWRFLSKQFRGATGLYHFNYVQMIGDEIWLTSRNLNAFIVFTPGQRRAQLRTINHKTTVCLHDGLKVGDTFLFTSIDGKIIKVFDENKSDYRVREEVEDITLFNRDLASNVIRLEDTDLGYEPNWCRGIAKSEHGYVTTIDGRYGSDLSFKILEISDDGQVNNLIKVRWDEITKLPGVRYVTGFDVEIIE